MTNLHKFIAEARKHNTGFLCVKNDDGSYSKYESVGDENLAIALDMLEVLYMEMNDIAQHSKTPFTGAEWMTYIHEHSAKALSRVEQIARGE